MRGFSLLRSVAIFAAAARAAPVVTITLAEPRTPLFSTNAAFASWNIDPSCKRGFHQTDFSNLNLAAAAAALAPSVLRFGGSGADALVYGLTPGSPECAAVNPVGCDYVTPGCLNASHWEGLRSLATASGAHFLFGISFDLTDACIAGAAYRWNETNAMRLLTYLQAHNESVWGFELGHEV